MAGEDRTEADRLALLRSLASAPYHYGFFQALRRLEAAYPEAPRIGCSVRPGEEAVRLGQEPSLGFAPSTIAAFSLPDDEHQRARLRVLFFGLFGPNGPLPLHLTEYVRGRIRNVNDHTLASFCDIFHHRMLALFYRAWSDAQPTSQLDRPDEDAFAHRLGSLIGIGTPQMRQRDALPDYAKLQFAGHLGRMTRNAEGLLSMLSTFFKMPVALEQYVGDWLVLPDENQLRLGETPDTGALGLTSILGGRVWECQHKFRLSLGPLDLAEYQRLLPGGSSLRKLVALVRNYLGDEFDWDVRLVLKGEEVRPAQLGTFGQLGWTSWSASRSPPSGDLGELCFNPMREFL